MSADDYQVGGEHYQSEYQHWNLCLAVPVSYLGSASTKYVSRWRKKSGLQDLHKALHYLNKQIESVDWEIKARVLLLNPLEIDREVQAFSEANQLNDLERAYVQALCTWQEVRDLEAARELLFLLMDQAEAIDLSKPVPLTDSNKHADRA